MPRKTHRIVRFVLHEGGRGSFYLRGLHPLDPRKPHWGFKRAAAPFILASHGVSKDRSLSQGLPKLDFRGETGIRPAT